MDLYQIRYFLTIAETGTFSRAAERLYLSQPSLSAGIKKLEQELGVTLFERGGRRTVLTPAGRLFMDKAQIIMAQYQAAIRELKGFNDALTLRLGVLSTMRVSLLAEFVNSFRKHHPQVTIELHDGTLIGLEEKLQDGDVDVTLTVLGLHGVDHPNPPPHSDTSNTLFRQSLWFATYPTHPLAQRSSIRLAELEDLPFIDRVHCEFFPKECQILDAANIHPKIVYRAQHEEWVISLVQSGLGSAIMPHWPGIPGIVYLPVTDLDFQRSLGLKWRSPKLKDASAEDSSKLLKEFCNFACSYDWMPENSR